MLMWQVPKKHTNLTVEENKKGPVNIMHQCVATEKNESKCGPETRTATT